MGEYDKLVSATHALLGKRNTASSSEIIHARQHADAVVMLPSSPGSFLELGAFALYPDICSKMLIIVDKKHELDLPNYLKLGPLISSQHNGAKLLYLDYGSTADCWAVVKEFVDDPPVFARGFGPIVDLLLTCGLERKKPPVRAARNVLICITNFGCGGRIWP